MDLILQNVLHIYIVDRESFGNAGSGVAALLLTALLALFGPTK